MKVLLISVALAVCFLAGSLAQPSSGDCTVTHYDTASYNNGVSGACGCPTGVAGYTTAALNQANFGVGPGVGAGPACGKCFKLRIYGDPYSPSWCTDSVPEIVVKVADLCPSGDNPTWCTSPNQFSSYVHFDLANGAAVSNLIAATGGRGAWKAKYYQVSCSLWAGNGAYNTNSGTCPQYNDAGAVSNPSFSNQCSGSTSGGSTSGGSGSTGLVFNPNVNAWWPAFALQAYSVNINCGGGYVAMTRQSWLLSNVPVWAWSATYPCPSTFSVQYFDASGQHTLTATGPW